VRSETWSNFAFAEENDDTFLLLRVLVDADLRAGEHFRAFVRLRSALSTDRDLPGGRRGLDADDFDFQDAFVDLMLPLGSDVVLTARGGREGLLLGNQRLVSPLGWANTQRTFDGASALVSSGDMVIRGFWAQPVVIDKTEFNRSDPARNLFGVYASDALPNAAPVLDLYWIGIVRDSTVINGTSGRETRHTVGGRLGKTASAGFAYDVEVGYQFGKLGDENIAAFMATTELAYALSGSTHPRLRVAVDYASGDDGAGGSVGTFDQLFPLGHAYLGFADVVGRRNVLALSAGGNLRPVGALNLLITGHHFQRANLGDGLYNAGGRLIRGPEMSSSRTVGTEIDFRANYRFTDQISALLGYSRFFAGSFIEDTGPSENIDFLYLSGAFSW
jgi:hypothetical protein